MTAYCACGNASITVNAKPAMHGVCHCTNCKRRPGSAFGISAYFDRNSVVATTGEMIVYAFHHTAQNHDQERHFCKTYGTTLYWFLSALPEKIGIAGGCFEDIEFSQPDMSVSHLKKASWVGVPEDWKVQP